MIKVSNRDKKPLAPSELGKLYPTPKTYDEIQADNDERQEILKTFRTRMPAFKIAFFGSLLLGAIVLYATNVEVLWLIGGLAAIFFSFAVWLILLLFAFKWLHYTGAIFYEYNSPILLFWIIYVVVMAGATIAWRYSPLFTMDGYLRLAFLPAVQLVATYITAKILIKRML